MPKGVAMLLRRWMKLQQGEKTGGDVSFDISVDAAGVALPIFKDKDISRISKGGNKLDSKLKGDKKVRHICIYIYIYDKLVHKI
jgi:hypothetical protein